MKIRAAENLHDFNLAFDLMKNAMPDRARYSGHGQVLFQNIFLNNKAVCILVEDSTGIVGTSIATVKGNVLVHADEFIPSDLDSDRCRSDIVDMLVRGGELAGAERLASPSRQVNAEIYESLGFSSTLFIQMYGPDREYWRRHLIREICDEYRVLGLRTFKHEVAQVIVRLPRVNDVLLNYVENQIPACEGGSLFMMNRWIGDDHGPDENGIVNYRRPRYVLTFHPRFRKAAVTEALDVDPLAIVAKTPDADRAIMAAETAGHDLDSAFVAQRPVFIRHLAPISKQIRLLGDETDIERICASVVGLRTLVSSCTFAVECRKAIKTAAGSHADATYGSRDVEVHVGETLEALGYNADLQTPEQIVSIYLSENNAYIGASSVTNNISRRADEYRARSDTKNLVSRAQHKLAEAIEEFQIDISDGMSALDLGAAPGGWTKVLADAGARVVAVDPGILSPLLDGHPNVTNKRNRIEELNFSEDHFDIFVNDMSLDPSESAGLMCRIARNLAPDGLAVMTIKFPTMHVKKHITDARTVLEHAYHIREIRHLFHNRQEVTVLLRRREKMRSGWEDSIVLRGAARKNDDIP